jgi:hypothetical protein
MHHPPILNYYGLHPLFNSFGYAEMQVNSGANSLHIENKGKHYIKFKDGTLFRLISPNMMISGMIMGKRYLNFIDNIVIEDLV